ncbi:hypothetical protein GCM10025734_22580 [Kitasatospora paranensis]|uniref:hypothetical protein n=1 Tax=Kitasatospora paranensis TaxID=258053 RepID=UPI0031F06AD7
MTGRKRRRAARPGRGALRIACVLLAAALAPVAGPAARARADTGVAAVAARPGTVTALSPPADIEAASAALVREVEDYNRREAETARQAAKLVAEAEQITKESAAWNKEADTYNGKDSAVGKEIDAFNARSRDLDARIAAHNGRQSTFELPREAAASAAYRAEADALNAEKAALEAEQSTIRGEQSQLDEEEARLGAGKERLTSAMTAHNAQVSALQRDEQQLESRGRDLLQQMATAVQSLADNPPDAAAAMDQGGDAAGPPQQSDRSAGQGADDPAEGGDSASRLPQQAALRAYAERTGATVDMRPGTAFLSPGAIAALPASQAAPLTSPAVSYDGLVRNGNGTYTALEVQTPGAASPARAALTAATGRGGRPRSRSAARSTSSPMSLPSRRSPSPHRRPVPRRPRPPAARPTAWPIPAGSSAAADGSSTRPRTWTTSTRRYPPGEGPAPGPARPRPAWPPPRHGRDRGRGRHHRLAGRDREGARGIPRPVPPDRPATRREGRQAVLVEPLPVPAARGEHHQLRHAALRDTGGEGGAAGRRLCGPARGRGGEVRGEPLYKDDTSTIPWAVSMTAMIQLPDGATWPLFFADTVENVPEGGGANLGN